MHTEQPIQPEAAALSGIRIVYIILLFIPAVVLGYGYYFVDVAAINYPVPLTLRSILYFVVIVCFPLTNLLRFIMLRLNQTMPGNKSAASRYFGTVLFSLLVSVSFAGVGLGLFLYGDTFDTLIIYCVLSMLALILYRPRQEEYLDIVHALQQKQEEQ